MLGPTMLRVVGQQCCGRLHGPLASAENRSRLMMHLLAMKATND